MRITKFDHGYQNLNPSGVIQNWDEFCDLIGTVDIGEKNGSYFLRGECEGERCDDNIKNVSLIVIDGDQSLTDAGTCCPPQDVHKCLSDKNITHMVYNSYSNDLFNNVHKWRCVIPTNSIIDQPTLVQGVEEIITILHKCGVMVRNVKENMTLSQPWFFPRCPEGREGDFYSAYHDGDEYCFTGSVADSARFNSSAVEGVKTSAGGNFSWQYVIDQFQGGTLHMGLKSACGWLVFTTDWADSQIEQHLSAMVGAICTDDVKIKRAQNGEIKKLIKYCRAKSGVIEHSANWKDHLISGGELRDKEFPPVKWAVDDLIPEGLVVLAGDPKSGKSLMALDICNSIASGDMAFGSQQCNHGDVVYCSLEDPQRRVKERIRQQCDKWPDTFHLVDGGIPHLGPDFYKIFDEMVLLWPKMRAVIVDTLSFIIPAKSNGVSDYDHYYKCLDPLHRWSLDNSIAVILITHKSKATKQAGDNPFAGIIGSVAIQGCSDAMIMLTRNHAKNGIIDPSLADGFLDITGREVGGAHYALDFDEECMKWALRNEIKAKSGVSNPNWLIIIDALSKGKMSVNNLSIETKINKATVRSCLGRMKKQDKVTNIDGVWDITEVSNSSGKVDFNW